MTKSDVSVTGSLSTSEPLLRFKVGPWVDQYEIMSAKWLKLINDSQESCYSLNISALNLLTLNILPKWKKTTTADYVGPPCCFPELPPTMWEIDQVSIWSLICFQKLKKGKNNVSEYFFQFFVNCYSSYMHAKYSLNKYSTTWCK